MVFPSVKELPCLRVLTKSLFAILFSNSLFVQDDSDGEYDGGGRKKGLADKPVAFVSAEEKADKRKDKVLYGEYEYVAHPSTRRDLLSRFTGVDGAAYAMLLVMCVGMASARVDGTIATMMTSRGKGMRMPVVLTMTGIGPASARVGASR
jgi:hypothetical protein